MAVTGQCLLLSFAELQRERGPRVHEGGRAAPALSFGHLKCCLAAQGLSNHIHTPEWLLACVTVTLTAATPVLPVPHPCVHGTEAPSVPNGPLTPCSVL